MSPEPKLTAAAAQVQIRDLETKLRIEHHMRDLTNRFHSSTPDEIMLAVKEDVAKLLGAKRVTIYVKDPSKPEIVSKLKDGVEVKEIRVPFGGGIAGYVAQTLKGVRLTDAYDAKESAVIDPKLKFAREWDTATGFTTKQVLCAPALKDGKLYGVVQALNTHDGQPFTDDHQRIISDLAGTMALALHNKQKLSGRSSALDSLLRNDVITQDTFDRALSQAQASGTSMELVLVTKFNVPVSAIAQSLKEYYRCDFVAYETTLSPPKELLDKFTVDYLKYHLVCPLGTDGNKIVILMANPRSLTDRDDLARRLGGANLLVKVAIKEHVIEFIDDFYGLKKPDGPKPEDVKSVDLNKIIANMERKEAEGDGTTVQTAEEKSEDDASIIGLANQVISQAYRMGASDIHVEPYLDGDLMIRVRIDGNCIEMPNGRLPGSYGRALVSRLKIMAELDIAERRLPQDGKIQFRKYGPLDIELRVATLPTAGGTEDVVMRILAASKPRKLDELMFLPENLSRFRKVIDLPYGIVLCVGPTGSGKTTTLHSALGELNKPDVKIWTAEDPVEITQKGLRQVQTLAKIGFTFERALRAFLRADPDIIMIGEMRDVETAGAAIEASLTGHMVFSTLHTNSAPETVTRLLDLGLDPYAFGDSLLAVLAQRLMRSLCKSCKQRVECPESEWEKLRAEYGDDAAWEALKFDRKEVPYHVPKGCDKCNGTGYKGRVGIHELLVSNDDIRLMIYRKAKSMEIRDAGVKQGMILLKQDGIRKVLMGHTDLREVLSVAAK